MAYQLVRDFVYDLGKVYEGWAVESTFEFATPPGPLAKPIADGIIDTLEAKCVENNLYTLRTKVYVDYSPALETKFLVVFSLYTEEVHSPVPLWLIALLPLIIKAVVTIVVVVFLYLVVRSIKDISYSPAGPAVGQAFKWLAIGLVVFAGSMLIREIISAIPKKEVKAA